MGPTKSFDKNDKRIIDTVEYNGKYTNVSEVTFIRARLITAGAALFALIALVASQFFLP